MHVYVLEHFFSDILSNLTGRDFVLYRASFQKYRNMHFNYK